VSPWRSALRSTAAKSSGPSAACGVAQQHDALAQLPRELVLAALELAAQLVAPRGEDVGPRLDRPLPAADRIHDERAGPADAVDVRVERVQLALRPGVRAGEPVHDDGPQLLVPVAEHVAGHLDQVADRALHRIASAVDHRIGILDVDAGGW
jgi:hypothetical protein